MGLYQLLFITDEGSKYRDDAIKIYKDSAHPTTWYFFAVAGLNISQKVLLTFLEDYEFKCFIASKYRKLESLQKRRKIKDDRFDRFNKEITEQTTIELKNT